MIKRYVSAVVFGVLVCTAAAHAQLAIELSPAVVIPGAETTDEAKVGYGFYGQVEYPMNEILSFGVSGGFLKFSEKNSVQLTATTGEVYIRSALKDFSDNLYMMLLIGIVHWDEDYAPSTSRDDFARNEMGFGFALGYVFPVTEHFGIDLSAGGHYADKMFYTVRAGLKYTL